MKSLADILFIVVALIALVIAVYEFVIFVKRPTSDPNHMTYLWYAIGAAVIACVSALAYFLRHVNKEEEIHITQ